MSIALDEFGWEGLSIPEDLTTVCLSLPSVKDLKVLRSRQSFHGTDVYFPRKFFSLNGEKYMPAFIKEAPLAEGGYAKLFRGRRAIFKPIDDKTTGSVNLMKTEPFKPICIKTVPLQILPEEELATPHTKTRTYDEEIRAILYEAFLHALLYKTLQASGFESAVPRMYDVVAVTKKNVDSHSPTDFDSIWITMELIQGMTLEAFLRKALKPRALKENTRILFDVCVQLAFYLHILQEKLRFNHRDLKINNIYVRHHEADEAWTKTLDIPHIGKWTCLNDIVLIDFGFSCIACGSGFANPRASLVMAGSWFRAEHDCLKYGRDISQFLYSVHCSFPLTDYVTPEFYSTIHDSLLADRNGYKIDLMNGFDGDGHPLIYTRPPKYLKFNDGIYIFLRDNAVDVPECRPIRFLEHLAPFVATF
jgi:serine/threonine protein kinase